MTHACIVNMEGSIGSASVGSVGLIMTAAAAAVQRRLRHIPTIVGIGIGMLATVVATPPK